MVAYAALFTAIIIATIGDIFMKKSEGFRIKKSTLGLSRYSYIFQPSIYYQL